MTETNIQKILAHYTIKKAHHPVAPNIYLFDWESDFVSVTKTGYVHEFEIKVSVADFKKDSEKTGRHQVLATGSREPTRDEHHLRDRYLQPNPAPWVKTRVDAIPGLVHGQVFAARPNYFWYVTPENLVAATDIPQHAGLLHISVSGNMTAVKEAPVLHKDKITPQQRDKLIVSCYYRFWRMWMKLARKGQQDAFEKDSQAIPV